MLPLLQVTLRFAAAAQQQGIEYTITVVAIYVRHPAACWGACHGACRHACCVTWPACPPIASLFISVPAGVACACREAKQAQLAMLFGLLTPGEGSAMCCTSVWGLSPSGDAAGFRPPHTCICMRCSLPTCIIARAGPITLARKRISRASGGSVAAAGRSAGGTVTAARTVATAADAALCVLQQMKPPPSPPFRCGSCAAAGAAPGPLSCCRPSAPLACCRACISACSTPADSHSPSLRPVLLLPSLLL